MEGRGNLKQYQTKDDKILKPKTPMSRMVLRDASASKNHPLGRPDKKVGKGPLGHIWS